MNHSATLTKFVVLVSKIWINWVAFKSIAYRNCSTTKISPDRQRRRFSNTEAQPPTIENRCFKAVSIGLTKPLNMQAYGSQVGHVRSCMLSGSFPSCFPLLTSGSTKSRVRTAWFMREAFVSESCGIPLAKQPKRHLPLRSVERERERDPETGVLYLLDDVLLL